MEKLDFLRLLEKYSNGTATEEERQFLFSYYKLFDSEPNVLKSLSEEKRKHLKKQIRSSVWDRINSIEQQESKNRIGAKWIGRISAAIFFLVICAASFHYFSPDWNKQPGIIVKVEQGGQNRLVHLPDGSTVMVNAGSELRYPSSFEDLSKREVSIEGQAFFDIVHNPTKPFIVNTGNLTTTVLGTAFNIEAYPEDENISITVTRGKVEIADQHKVFGVLRSNDQLIYHKKKAEIVRQKVNVQVHLDWKKQDLFLKDVTLEKAGKILEKRFNVKINYQSESLRSIRFTTTFREEESLEMILKSICEFSDAVYHFDNNKRAVIIMDERQKIPAYNQERNKKKP